MHFYSENPLGEIESHDLTQSKGHKLGYYASVTSKMPSDPEALKYMFVDNTIRAYMLGLGKRTSEIMPYIYGFVCPEDTIACKKHTPVSEWGTEGHAALEWGDTLSEKFFGHVALFHKWLKDEGYRVVEHERKVISHELEVGGTIDLVLEKKSKYYLADFKFRGKSMRWMESDGRQLALYSEITKEDISGTISIIFDRITPNMNIKIWSKEEREELLQSALNWNHAYNYDANRKWKKK